MRAGLFWSYDNKKNCDEMHPAEELCGKSSSKLKHKRIVLGVTGSIAAVESVKLARELIRHGAMVYPVMTPAATRIIHPDALEFATSRKPVIQLSGQTEHVAWCGLVADPVDLLLISPATANTISKITHGIDDTAVSTCATTALGSKVPLLLVPSMHLSMYDHNILQENIALCKKQGVLFLDPSISGNKAKSPTVNEIVRTVIRLLGSQDLSHKKILIIGGATAEPIDDIRVLTNRSSGKTAVSLSENAYERGADVSLWLGHAHTPIPSYIPCETYETVDDLLRLIKKLKKTTYEGIIVCAALANYIPKKKKGKIPSGIKNFTIACETAPTVLSALRNAAPHAQIIAFKTEEKKKNVATRTKQMLTKHHLAGAVGNTLAGFQGDSNEIYLLTKKGKGTWMSGKKENLAAFILDMLH